MPPPLRMTTLKINSRSQFRMTIWKRQSEGVCHCGQTQILRLRRLKHAASAQDDILEVQLRMTIREGWCCCSMTFEADAQRIVFGSKLADQVAAHTFWLAARSSKLVANLSISRSTPGGLVPCNPWPLPGPCGRCRRACCCWVCSRRCTGCAVRSGSGRTPAATSLRCCRPR